MAERGVGVGLIGLGTIGTGVAKVLQRNAAVIEQRLGFPLRLARAVAGAFAGSRASYQTLGVVILHRGRIVAERYAAGWGVHTQYRTWSTAKSISNALIGVLVKRGVLDVDAPAPIPEWRHPLDPRRAITLDHLLRMSSGLHSGGNQTPLGYWGGIDIAADAASAPLERIGPH